MIDSSTLWLVILGLGAGSFALRFAFLGLVGDRPMPAWLLRHLRYTAVAVLPALVAPVVFLSPDGALEPEPARLAAAVATVLAGWMTRNVFAAIGAGAGTLYGMLWLLAA